MDLNEISKKDKYWREIALFLTKDKSVADDIVQDMYLKVFKLKNDKIIKDNYIKKIIIHLWIDNCRKKTNINIDSLFFLEDEKIGFEIDDDDFFLLKMVGNLPKHQQEYLEYSYNNSLRKIAKKFNVNYGYVFRELKKAKEKITNN